MNILFFGSSSFASQDLIKELKKKNNVIDFSRNPIKNDSSHYFDLNSKKNIFKKIKIKTVDYLFFFSSYVPIKENEARWLDCKNTNILGLSNLLKNINFPIKKVILASSCSVYGSNKDINFDESKITTPNNYYALSKLAQENIFNVYCKKNKIKFLSYRLGYVYGKNMNNERILKKIINSLKNKNKIYLYNKKTNLNLVHTSEISEIILATYKKATGIYNLTHKYKINLKEYYNFLKHNKKIYIKISNNYNMKKMFKSFKNIKTKNIHPLLQQLIYEI